MFWKPQSLAVLKSSNVFDTNGPSEIFVLTVDPSYYLEDTDMKWTLLKKDLIISETLFSLTLKKRKSLYFKRNVLSDTHQPLYIGLEIALNIKNGVSFDSGTKFGKLLLKE